MVSGVPKPQVLAICSMVLLVVSRSRHADSSRTASTWSAAVTPTSALKTRVNCRSERLICRASAGHGQVVGEVVTQPGQQVAHRFGVGCLPGQDRGELRLAAGAPQVDDQLTGDGGGGLVSVVVGDESEREVDAGGDAGGGPHVAVVHVDGVGVDGDVDVGVVEQSAFRPVGGGPSSVQQAGRGEHEGAGADRGHAACAGGEPPDMGEQLGVRDGRVHVGATGHHQRVDGPGDPVIGDDANSSPQLA